MTETPPSVPASERGLDRWLEQRIKHVLRIADHLEKEVAVPMARWRLALDGAREGQKPPEAEPPATGLKAELIAALDRMENLAKTVAGHVDALRHE